MPYLTLACASPTPVDFGELAATLTDLTAELLGKARGLTVVAVHPVAVDHWFVGGAPLSEGSAGAVLEIRITAGTNTKAQKAAFVRAAFAALEARLGGLDPASYVTLHEPPADAWGYSGQTQEFRFVRSQPL